MLLESQFNTIDQQQPILCQKNHINLLKCQHKAVTGGTLALGTSDLICSSKVWLPEDLPAPFDITTCTCTG